MTEIGERIHWIPNRHGGYLGHVGTLEPWVFQIWHPDTPKVESYWQLDSTLPGQQFQPVWDDKVTTLKAVAEGLLGAFLATLGAGFLPATADHPEGVRGS